MPVGSDRYVEAMLEEKVDKIAEAAEKAVKVLAGERQALWAVIKWSVSQQFEYWLQHCYPTGAEILIQNKQPNSSLNLFNLYRQAWRMGVHKTFFLKCRGEGVSSNLNKINVAIH